MVGNIDYMSTFDMQWSICHVCKTKCVNNVFLFFDTLTIILQQP
jgi:hypothetical protein